MCKGKFLPLRLMEDPMRFIPEVEVTEQLGLSPNTLPSLRRAKRGPKWYKPGSKAYYQKESIDEWVATCIQDPNADTEVVDEVEQPEEGDGDE